MRDFINVIISIALGCVLSLFLMFFFVFLGNVSELSGFFNFLAIVLSILATILIVYFLDTNFFEGLTFLSVIILIVIDKFIFPIGIVDSFWKTLF